MSNEHDHNRTFCSCGTLLYDGWLNPDGTGHQCEFWPPSNAGPKRALSALVYRWSSERWYLAWVGPVPFPRRRLLDATREERE